MRILFVTPHSTHYYAMVTLAWACRAAGHDVRIAAHPSVMDAIKQSGMMGVPVGGGYDFIGGMAGVQRTLAERLGNDPAKADIQAIPPDVLKQLLELRFVPHAKAAEDIAGDLVAYATAWRPALIVSDPIILAAPLAAAAIGVPLVHHLFGPDVPRLAGFPGLGMAPEQWPDALRDLYGRYGVEPRPAYAVRTVDPVPASVQLGEVPNRIPVRYDPYNGPGELPAWLREPAQRTRVCVTGGMTNAELVGTEGFLLPTIFSALDGFDVEIVAALSASDSETLGEPPANVRVAVQLPLRMLLPTCDMIVHHGGAGSLLTAAFCGTPQMMVAPIADQVLNAQQLQSTGAGIALKAGQQGADAIKSAAATILDADSAVREAARNLRAEILAQPAPAQIVATLEELS